LNILWLLFEEDTEIDGFSVDGVVSDGAYGTDPVPEIGMYGASREITGDIFGNDVVTEGETKCCEFDGDNEDIDGDKIGESGATSGGTTVGG
jgi:hypothetical protein